MQKRSIKIILTVILVLVILGSINTAYSGLNKKELNIIKIAFMNGFIEALKLSTEEKKRLENDMVAMQKAVESAAERYLEMVENLNK